MVIATYQDLCIDHDPVPELTTVEHRIHVDVTTADPDGNEPRASTD